MTEKKKFSRKEGGGSRGGASFPAAERPLLPSLPQFRCPCTQDKGLPGGEKAVAENGSVF